MHDVFYMYQGLRNKIVQVFLVLNQNAIFIYRAREHYQKRPDKPKGVVLFSELRRLVSRKVSAQGLFKNCESIKEEIGFKDFMHILHLEFSESYQQSVQQIWNFKYTDLQGKNLLVEREKFPGEMKRKKVRMGRKEKDCGDKKLIFMSGSKDLVSLWCKVSLMLHKKAKMPM